MSLRGKLTLNTASFSFIAPVRPVSCSMRAVFRAVVCAKAAGITQSAAHTNAEARHRCIAFMWLTSNPPPSPIGLRERVTSDQVVAVFVDFALVGRQHEQNGTMVLHLRDGGKYRAFMLLLRRRDEIGQGMLCERHQGQMCRRARDVLEVFEHLGFRRPRHLARITAEFLEDVMLWSDSQPFLCGIDRKGKLLVIVKLEFGRNGSLSTLRDLPHPIG